MFQQLGRCIPPTNTGMMQSYHPPHRSITDQLMPSQGPPPQGTPEPVMQPHNYRMQPHQGSTSPTSKARRYPCFSQVNQQRHRMRGTWLYLANQENKSASRWCLIITLSSRSGSNSQLRQHEQLMVLFKGITTLRAQQQEPASPGCSAPTTGNSPTRVKPQQG